ncbi:MAG: phosphate starvation-inducible protein PhoH [Sphingobium sp.]|nr:MAG: phosphate starvation-inducible protein PhoH [Sphingobium sp.]
MGKKPHHPRTDIAERARLEVTFEKPHLLGALFGQYDQNLVAIENRLGVYIAARGNKLQIEGEAEAAARARDVMTGLYNRIVAGQEIDNGAVEAVIAMSAEPTLDGIIRHDVAEPPKVMIRTRKKTIVPRSATQVAYMEALTRNDIIFALGPAGTGKTYLAVAQAVSQLITGSVDRLILSRPAVEAGEKLGFLPGDMKEKVDPYLRPIYDALQNTTIAQMKMFLTRFGEGSRMVICGDPKQVDLPQPGISGLADAVARLDGVEGIAMVPFGIGDVVRHPVVGRIVQAYEGPDA